MISYIRSEFYRVLHYKWAYLFIIISSLLLVSSNVVLAVVKASDSNFKYATTMFSFSNLYTGMLMILILCIPVANMIFGNEYNNHTLKNCVSFGISRSTIYFGKLIVQISYALVAFAAITGFHILSGYLLLKNSGPEQITMLLRTFLACLPFLLFALAVTNCFLFIMESSGVAITAACGVIIVIPMISNLLGMKFEFFKKVGELLPWNLVEWINFNFDKHVLELYWKAGEGFRNYWIIGIVEMILISLLGFMVFRKKEIK